MRESREGNEQGMNEAISQIHLLSSSQESQALLREIALITREVYNSLNDLSNDLPYDQLVESSEGISEAVRKLRVVIIRLEEAASQNLDYLELANSHLPAMKKNLAAVVEGITAGSEKIELLAAQHPALQEELMGLKASFEDQLAPGLAAFSEQTAAQGGVLMELMANQSFQDLTGQTLKKVIDFIDFLETKLVALLEKYKPIMEVEASAPTINPVIEQDSGEPEQQQTQDQVDNLLAELGF